MTNIFKRIKTQEQQYLEKYHCNIDFGLCRHARYMVILLESYRQYKSNTINIPLTTESLR